MKIQESAENYLETIYILTRRNGIVRSIDIVNELDFTKPSVSVAMKNLRENGYIKMDENGYITLTPKGSQIAETMYELTHRLADFSRCRSENGGRRCLPGGACYQCAKLSGNQKTYTVKQRIKAFIA